MEHGSSAVFTLPTKANFGLFIGCHQSRVCSQASNLQIRPTTGFLSAILPQRSPTAEKSCLLSSDAVRMLPDWTVWTYRPLPPQTAPVHYPGTFQYLHFPPRFSQCTGLLFLILPNLIILSFPCSPALNSYFPRPLIHSFIKIRSFYYFVPSKSRLTCFHSINDETHKCQSFKISRTH